MTKAQLVKILEKYTDETEIEIEDGECYRMPILQVYRDRDSLPIVLASHTHKAE